MANVDNLTPFWGSWDVFDAASMDEFTELVEKYGDAAQRVINNVVHEEGAEEIKKEIARLLPASGRKWKGKGAPARSVMPAKFEQDEDLLAVTIAARGKYHYLYFPDDGSNTKRHAGNQEFMYRGADKAAPKVLELCLGRLINYPSAHALDSLETCLSPVL